MLHFGFNGFFCALRGPVERKKPFNHLSLTTKMSGFLVKIESWVKLVEIKQVLDSP